MKIQEIIQLLQGIAAQEEAASVAVAEPTIIDVVAEPEDDVGMFMPPLQQHLELAKKSEGLPNEYDDQECHPDDQALIDIKRLTGLGPLGM